MIGWIKLHRKLMEKSIWLNSTPEQKVVLITLLLLANHSENEWEWQGKEYVCQPGQFITSSASIEAHSGKGLSRQKIRTAIDRFKKLGFLTIETTSVNSLITICKWETYQKSIDNNNQDDNQRITNDQPAGNQQVTTNKNVKKEKNANNEKKTIFPDELDTPDFLKAWSEWEKHRKEIKKKLTPSTISKQLKMLSKHPVTVAISTIERSIQNGWTGLFPEKETNERNTIPTNKRKHEDFSNQKSSFGVSFSNAT